jgi:hypothetical protein
MGVIGSPEDRYLIERESTDISICMINNFNSKSLEIEADMKFSGFYALTYILFKHGS